MGKVIITGPGRSGTTFLVQLLTRLGFDTGYEPYQEAYVPELRAGCEWRVEGEFQPPFTELKATVEGAPYVLKSPEWSLVLKDFVRAGVMEVDHVFIPVRDLDEAARSRLDVGLDWQVCETDDYAYRLMDQASVHALALGRAVEACEVCSIPYTLMRFPALVQQRYYCYRRLRRGLEGIYWPQFKMVFAELAKPERVKWTSTGC